MRVPGATRRRFLGVFAAGLSVCLAGCSRKSDRLDFTEVESNEEVGTAIAVSNHRRESLLEEAVETDSAEITGSVKRPRHVATTDERQEAVADQHKALILSSPPWQPSRPVVHRDQVYDVNWVPEYGQQGALYETNDWEAAPGEIQTIYGVTALSVEEQASDETAIAFDDLPEYDRRRLDHLQDGEISEARFANTEWYVPSEDSVEESAFVPDQQYDRIAVDGDFVVIETRETRAIALTYRYDVERIAESVADFGAEIRTEYEFVLDALSEDERAIVEAAIEDEYTTTEKEEAFVGIGERLAEEDPIKSDGTNSFEWITEYDGSSYWVKLSVSTNTEFTESIEATSAWNG